MEYCNDFEYDLKVGQCFEKELGQILNNKKIEVKTDFQTYKTGNIFLEFRSRGEKSGIAKTKADYYSFILLDKDEKINTIILIPIKKLKKIARKSYKKNGYIKGGDKNTSLGILIPVEKLAKRSD